MLLIRNVASSPLTLLLTRPRILIHSQTFLARATFRSTSRIMAQEYKLKGLTSLDLNEGQMQEAEVEGIEDGKVLLIKNQGQVHATGAKCTHYGAPLKNGVVSSDGRLTCPWHGGKQLLSVVQSWY